MYICEYNFLDEDPNIPGYSMSEVDYYAWIPADKQKEIPNHRLTLTKNLMTKEYEFHRVYMNTVIGQLRGLGIVVTQQEKGYTEVAFKTKDLQEALDWGNREWNRFHQEDDYEREPDKVCTHGDWPGTAIRPPRWRTARRSRSAMFCPVTKGLVDPKNPKPGDEGQTLDLT